MKIRVKKDLILEVGMEGPVRGAMQDKLDPEKVKQQVSTTPDKLARTLQSTAEQAKNDPLLALQVLLEFAGMVPAIGSVADLLSAGIALARGEKFEALINVMAALPLVGLSSGLLRAAYRKGGTKALGEAIKLIWKRSTGREITEKALKSSVEEVTSSAKEVVTKYLKDAGYDNKVIAFINNNFEKLELFMVPAILSLAGYQIYQIISQPQIDDATDPGLINPLDQFKQQYENPMVIANR